MGCGVQGEAWGGVGRVWVVKRTVTYSPLKVHCTDQHNFGCWSCDAAVTGELLAPRTTAGLRNSNGVKKKNNYRGDVHAKGDRASPTPQCVACDGGGAVRFC